MKYLALFFLLFIKSITAFCQVDVISESLSATGNSQRSSTWVIESNSNLDSGAVALYTSKKKVKLRPGFKVQKGANFKAYIAENLPLVATFAVFPNPFSDALEVDFELTEGTVVSLNVYDLNGRVVEQPISGEFIEKGKTKKTIEATGFAAGTYLISLNARNFVRTVKAIKR